MKEIHHELEKWLLSQWETLLNLSGIDPNDHFIESGGNSILALRLANRLNEKLGVHIQPVMVLTVDTVASQADVLISNFEQEVRAAFGAQDGFNQKVSQEKKREQATSIPASSSEQVIPTAADSIIQDLDQLSEDEIERLLGEDSKEGGSDS